MAPNFIWSNGTATTNLFQIDPATRQATFITTTSVAWPSWALFAGANHVMWQGACINEQIRLYDRRSGEHVELVRADQAVLTPGGLLAIGNYGVKWLVDPATLEYRAVLPANALTPVWSSDYRYAAVSFPRPHGDRCGS